MAARCSDVNYYYSPGSEQCEPCAGICTSTAASNECLHYCQEYVNHLYRQQSSAVMSSVMPWSAVVGSTLAATVLFIVAIAVIGYFVWSRRCKARRYRQPPRNPDLETAAADGPHDESLPLQPTDTDPAGSSPAQHPFVPSVHRQPPYIGHVLRA